MEVLTVVFDTGHQEATRPCGWGDQNIKFIVTPVAQQTRPQSSLRSDRNGRRIALPDLYKCIPTVIT